MEKIQQAIERARRQRASHAEPVGTSSTVTTKRRDAPAPALGGLLENSRIVEADRRHLRNRRLLAALLDDARSDVFRKLRTQTMLRLQAIDGHSVAVLSARDGEGKTLVACNLALGIAHQSGAPTFLLDMDFRRPSVHDAFGFEPRHSLSEVFDGTAGLEDVFVRIGETRLYVLPQARSTEHASELIASPRCRELVHQLTNGFPGAKVVVDCPPLLLTDEPLMVQGFVDGCLLVVEQGRTTRDDVERAVEYLDETKYLGSVLNRSNAAEAEVYYGYR